MLVDAERLGALPGHSFQRVLEHAIVRWDLCAGISRSSWRNTQAPLPVMTLLHRWCACPNRGRDVVGLQLLSAGRSSSALVGSGGQPEGCWAACMDDDVARAPQITELQWRPPPSPGPRGGPLGLVGCSWEVDVAVQEAVAGRCWAVQPLAVLTPSTLASAAQLAQRSPATASVPGLVEGVVLQLFDKVRWRGVRCWVAEKLQER
jgi:hypothetical protein